MNREEVEIEVFDLLEEKDFQELSGSEQSKVLTVITQPHYELQRRIIVEASESEKLVAGPLVIPAKRGVVPIWFASISSAAAAAILVFLLVPPANDIEVKVQSASPKVVHDTLIVENTVTDTIIDYQIVKVTETIRDCNETALVQVPVANTGAAVVPPIRQEKLVNVGVSAANDMLIEAFRTQPFIGM
jgi:hypothetical protein